jgi:hypothetical protein
MSASEKYADLEFPLGGVDTLQENQEQPPGTCADAVNVRGTNPDSLRARGGSRAGLVKYLPDPLIAGGSIIQHLNVIVDPQATRLRITVPIPDDTWVEDPLFPGTFVPPGGWGNPPNPYATQPEPPSTEPAYRQSKVLGFGLGNTEQSVTFDTDALFNSLIVVAVVTSDGGINTLGVTVTDGVNASFTQAGSYQRFIKTAQEHTLSLWYKIGNGTAAARSEVQVDPSGDCTLCVGILEFTGIVTTSPLDSTNGAFDSSGTVSMSPGQVTIGGNNEVVVAAYAGVNAIDDITPAGGFTLAVNHNDGGPDFTDILLFVTYKLDFDLASDPTPSADWQGGADKWASAAASFKD